MLDRGLAGAIAARALVGLDRGVRRHVGHAWVCRVQEEGERVLDQAEGGDDVDLGRDAQVVQRVIGQRRQRRGPERPRVVHDEVEAAELERGGGQLVAVVRVCDVAGDRDHRRPWRRPDPDPARPPPGASGDRGRRPPSDQPARPDPSPPPPRVPGLAPVTIAALMVPTLPSGGAALSVEYNKYFLVLFRPDPQGSGPQGRSRRRSVIEAELENDEILPTTELGTEPGHHAHHLDESQSLVEAIDAPFAPSTAATIVCFPRCRASSMMLLGDRRHHVGFAGPSRS